MKIDSLDFGSVLKHTQNILFHQSVLADVKAGITDNKKAFIDGRFIGFLKETLTTDG